MKRRSVNEVTYKKTGDFTTATWTVGPFRQLSFGDSVTSSRPVPAGDNEWKFTLFPKGLTDPDWVSLYITNVDLDLEDAGSEIGARKRAVASIKVTFEPNSLEKDDDKRKKDGMNDNASVTSSARSRGSAGSSLSRLSKMSASTGRSSTGSQVSGSGGSAGSKGSNAAAAAAAVLIEKSLSQQFSAAEPSWGFEQFLEMDKVVPVELEIVYNVKTLFMGNVPGTKSSEKAANVQDGTLTMTIDILAITGLNFEIPNNDPDITDGGQQRTKWAIVDFKVAATCLAFALTNNPTVDPREQAIFRSDGEWYLDLYPNGYWGSEEIPEEKYISIYLHSSRKQVEMADTLKRSYKIGILKANPLNPEFYEALGEDPKVYYPPDASSFTNTFDGYKKSFGRQKFIKLKEIINGREIDKKVLSSISEDILPKEQELKNELVQGNYNKGGTVVLILDMAVTDIETSMVQEMLWVLPTFGAEVLKQCPETNVKLSQSGMFGGSVECSRCYFCGRMFALDALDVDKATRMPQFGYEIGKELIMDILMREEENKLQSVLRSVNPSQHMIAMNRVISKSIKKYQKQVKKDEVIADDNSVMDDSDEDDGTKPLNPLRNRKREKELARQLLFEKKLETLRAELEDAHFAKPVCSRCREACKALDACKIMTGRTVRAQTYVQLSNPGSSLTSPRGDHSAAADVSMKETSTMASPRSTSVRSWKSSSSQVYGFRMGWKEKL
eukprot:755889-Hanusia_phi.AAC.10